MSRTENQKHQSVIERVFHLFPAYLIENESLPKYLLKSMSKTSEQYSGYLTTTKKVVQCKSPTK